MKKAHLFSQGNQLVTIPGFQENFVSLKIGKSDEFDFAERIVCPVSGENTCSRTFAVLERKSLNLKISILIKICRIKIGNWQKFTSVVDRSVVSDESDCHNGMLKLLRFK